jgi:hypothetical protein
VELTWQLSKQHDLQGKDIVVLQDDGTNWSTRVVTNVTKRRVEDGNVTPMELSEHTDCNKGADDIMCDDLVCNEEDMNFVSNIILLAGSQN